MLCEGDVTINQVPKVIRDVKLSNYMEFQESAIRSAIDFGIIQRPPTRLYNTPPVDRGNLSSSNQLTFLRSHSTVKYNRNWNQITEDTERL
jgi:hypothetical protein